MFFKSVNKKINGNLCSEKSIKLCNFSMLVGERVESASMSINISVD